MKAILLAAGEGSRLRPLTINKPKPMVRVANKPIAQYAAEALIANGIIDLTFVVGYRRAKVQSHFGEGAKLGAKISYAFQEALFGTAHAVATAPEPRAPFVVVGADNIVEPALIKRLLDVGVDTPAVVIHRSPTPARYGVVETSSDHVVQIRERPQDPVSEWVNTGIYLFPARYWHDIGEFVQNGHLGLPDVISAIIERGEKVRAVKSEDYWSDAIYPWDLLGMHADLVRNAPVPELGPHVAAEESVLVGQGTSFGPNVTLGAGTCIGSNVQIGAGTIIENSVIYDDVQIGPGSVLQNTIVAEGTRIGPRFLAISGACDVRSPDGWHHLDDFGCILGEDVLIGGNVTVLPGSIVGNRAQIDHGKTVTRAVDENARVQ